MSRSRSSSERRKRPSSAARLEPLGKRSKKGPAPVMPDRLFSVRVLRPAEDFYVSLTAEEQAEVRRLIDILRIDPYIDGVHKFHYPSEIVVLTVYDSGTWAIVYRLAGNTELEV